MRTAVPALLLALSGCEPTEARDCSSLLHYPTRLAREDLRNNGFREALPEVPCKAEFSPLSGPEPGVYECSKPFHPDTFVCEEWAHRREEWRCLFLRPAAADTFCAVVVNGAIVSPRSSGRRRRRRSHRRPERSFR